jgi:hypothetical protein
LKATLSEGGWQGYWIAGVQTEVRVREKNLSNIIYHPLNELVICDWLLLISHFSLDQAEGNAF